MFVLFTALVNTASAQNYLPVVTWNGPTPPAEQSEPEYYQDVMDPAYNTYFKKVSNDNVPASDNKPGGHDRTYYSLRPVFNENSSMYLLNSDKIYRVDNNDFVGHLWYMVGNTSFKNPIWSKTDPNILYGTMGLKFVSLNVIDSTLTTIRDMEAEDGFVTSNGKIYMDNKQSISVDSEGRDQYVVLSDVPRGGTKIVVVDIQTGDRHAWIEDAYNNPYFTVRVDGGPDYRMNVGISPFGDYIVVGGQNKEVLFDDMFNYVRDLAPHGHADFAIDTEGNEVYVSICPVNYEILSSGVVVELMGGNYWSCGHLNASANYKQPGWAYLSINKDNNNVGDNGNSMGYEIIAVKLDGTGTNVRKVVHPHNAGQNNELSAYAVPNPDGTLLMFNSTWDNTDESKVNAYMVNLTSPYRLTTVTEGLGKVLSSANGDYFEGTLVKLQAYADWGYEFLGWEGDTVSTENPLTVSIDSNMYITAVFTGATGISDDFMDDSNMEINCYPNPSAGLVNITYELSTSANVKIAVVNQIGQTVALMLNENQDAGRRFIRFNGFDDSGNTLPDGIYIVKILVNNTFNAYSKLVISK